MTIIVSKGGIGATRVEDTGVPEEGYLQEYVANNPESLPFEDIRENVRLLIFGREFESGSGQIDVLAADDEGDIYVIETKLYRNADKRRVVAQVLDYGAALWRRRGVGDSQVMDAPAAAYQRQIRTRSWDQSGTKTAQTPWKTGVQGRPENKTSQQIANPTLSAKPPSPVQIRAAPPTLTR